MNDSPPDSAMIERLRRNDAGDKELRQAAAGLGALLRELPATDDLLLTSESQRWFRVLRDRNPEVYLVFRAAVRQKAGAHVTSLLDAYIGPPPSGPSKEVRLLTVSDLMLQPPPTWRVHGMIPDRGSGVIFGESGSGKSFFSLAMGCAIAQGKPFFSRETEPANVLYVAAEGRARDRIGAYIHQYDVDVGQLGVRFIEQSLDLCGFTTDLEKLEACVREFSPRVVLIDTLARVSGGGDENSAQDMGRLLSAFKRIEEACDGLVLVVHHSGKDISRGARGHSSLRAAADVEIEITRGDAGVRSARISKLRDYQDGAEFFFRLEPVDLGEGRSSCVVVPVDDAPRRQSKERHLTANEQLGLAALNEQLQESGQQLPETSTIPGGRAGVEIDAWRDRFYSSIGESIKADSQRKTFSRAKEGLLSKKVIGCWEKWAWKW